LNSPLANDNSSMKKTYVFFFFVLFYQCAFSQAGQWTWMNGSNTANGTAVYGTQGIPAPTNTPQALYEVCDWQDLNGNLWFFGGLNSFNERNDLWKYDPVTYQWTWMKGSGSAGNSATYGVKGIPSVSNNPGGRAWGAWSWVDSTNKLWMYGGIGYDANGKYECMSDLWKYDIGTNEWTWMQGPDSNTVSPVFGTMGVLDTANSPGARAESDASWVDHNNNLWLFGGALYTPQANGWSLTGFANDLWKYDMSTNSWAWIKGANVVNQPGVYGTKGIANINNVPPSMGTYTKWTDAAGDLWMFAGYDLSQGNFNAVWRYHIASNTWTWMSGSNLINQLTVENGKCNSSVSNTPSARYENRASAVDACGKFWTMGGSTSGGTNNDLWKFDPVNLNWTYVSCDTMANPTGVYGTQGLSSPLNDPPGRMGAGGWMDKNGNFWVFGGMSQIWSTVNNDMWRYVPDTSCSGTCAQGLPVANFTSSDTTFCSETGECIHFYDHSTGNPTSWHWIFTGASPGTSSLQNPDSICYFNVGIYPVTLIVTNSGGTDTLTVSPMIIFATTPPPPTINVVGGDTLFSSHGASYQWFLNGSLIAGATDSFYVAIQPGTYSVQITDGLGCNSLSSGIYVNINSLNDINGIQGIKIYPNPVSNELNILIQAPVLQKNGGDAAITDIVGMELFKIILVKDQSSYSISTNEFSNGMYILQIHIGEQTVNKKFVILHK